jgi:hypothetical protein
MSDIPRLHRVPTCFGKADVYDPVHKECRTCDVRVRCKVRVRNASKLQDKKSSSSSAVAIRSRGKVAKSDDDEPEFRTAKVRTKGWWEALGHNAFLRMGSTFLREAAFGVEQIPLEPYSDEELEND